MDHSPRVPAYICLNTFQVIFVLGINTFCLQIGHDYSSLFSFFSFLMLLPGSGSVAFSCNDNSRAYCFFHLYANCTFPSLVLCTSIGRCYRKTIWSSIGGRYGAGLGCAGTAFCSSLSP